MTSDDVLRGLPAEDLIRDGLADLVAGRGSVAACLAGIARTRFIRSGLLPPTAPAASANPELDLYRLLRGEGGDAYTRYNALVRELVSFQQALARRLRK